MAHVLPSVYSPERVAAMVFMGRAEPAVIVLISVVPRKEKKVLVVDTFCLTR
jgi:hypothetical protein